MNNRVGNFRILTGALGAAGLAALIGCGDLLGGPRAGGTIETTNGLSAKVVLPSGNPAARIKVLLINEQDWLEKTRDGASIVLDSQETTDSGSFEFRIKKTDSSRAVCLYADVEGYAFFIHRATPKALKENFHNLIGMYKKVSYEGNIRDPETRAQRIFLAGSPFTAPVDSTGHFVLNDVPQANYSVIIQRRLPDQSVEYVAGDNVVLNEKQVGKPDTLVTVPQKSFLLEDFEDKDINNRISGYFPTGEWNYYGDGDFWGRSSMSQPANLAPENWPTALEEVQPNNQALHVKYSAAGLLSRPVYQDSKAGTDPAYVSLMVNIGQYRKHYNFSKMDSLTFQAAGNGQLVVELMQENPKDSNGQQVVSLQVVASKTFDLGTWSSFSLTPAELAVHIGWFPTNPADYRNELLAAGLPAYDKAPTSWAEMGGKISIIRFKAIKGNEFWLDDIRIHGINVGDIIK